MGASQKEPFSSGLPSNINWPLNELPALMNMLFRDLEHSLKMNNANAMGRIGIEEEIGRTSGRNEAEKAAND